MSSPGSLGSDNELSGAPEGLLSALTAVRAADPACAYRRTMIQRKCPIVPLDSTALQAAWSTPVLTGTPAPLPDALGMDNPHM